MSQKLSFKPASGKSSGYRKFREDTPPPDPDQDHLRCTISGEKPRYAADDSDFAIWSANWDDTDFKAQAETALEQVTDPDRKAAIEKALRQRKPRTVTVKGPLKNAAKGERLICKGRWSKHPQYGWSFEVKSFSSTLPVEPDGVASWLQAKVHGVGPTFAKAIVDRFGAENVYDVLDADPTKLREVTTAKGRPMAKGQVEEAIKAWARVRDLREIETFLFSHGVSEARADQLYSHYGPGVIDILKEDPYRISEIRGIGFKIADKIAMGMGMNPKDPKRVRAAILYCLETAETDGHVFLPTEPLYEKARDVLSAGGATGEDVNRTIADAIKHLAGAGRIKIEEDDVVDARIYDQGMWELEERVAQLIRSLLNDGTGTPFPKPNRPTEGELLPTDDQWAAIEMVRKNRLSLLTGGPGVGKSQTVAYLMDAAQDAEIILAAPTGKAARRMFELTGHPAKTIHKLLEYSPMEGGFQRDEDNPLYGDLLIVDEASMLQLDLADHLLRAVPAGMHVLMVGDPDQLPPVGAGKVFDDLIHTSEVPRTHLDKVFRQAAKSMIIQNSRRLNQGEMPYLKKEDAEKEVGMEMLNDFFWVGRKDAESTLAMTIDMVANRIPRVFHHDPRTDIMVLVPQRAGRVGLHVINAVLEEKLNSDGMKQPAVVVPKPQVKAGEGTYDTSLRVGSRVVQTKNHYDYLDPDSSIMNGEVGMITSFQETDEGMIVTLKMEDDREIKIPAQDMKSFQLAWAMTVHRSQGSQWPCVVVPVSGSHYTMLSRNIEYVAVTRAEKLCVMVGEHTALRMAVKKKLMTRRNSTLSQRITKPELSGALV